MVQKTICVSGLAVIFDLKRFDASLVRLRQQKRLGVAVQHGHKALHSTNMMMSVKSELVIEFILFSLKIFIVEVGCFPYGNEQWYEQA